jgi:hypothetical protein
MEPRKFNPNNHFTKPLSATLIGRLAEVFAKHGVHLDTDKAISMSKVRAAVKAAKGRKSAGISFGGIGHIAGGRLIVGNQRIRIEEHNGHSCVRMTVGDSRVRLRLDALAEFMALIGLEGFPALYSSIENRTGELAPGAQKAVEADPLNDDLPENRPQSPGEIETSLLGELAPVSGPRSLSQRLAALKAAQQPRSMTSADSADPLSL